MCLTSHDFDVAIFPIIISSILHAYQILHITNRINSSGLLELDFYDIDDNYQSLAKVSYDTICFFFMYYKPRLFLLCDYSEPKILLFSGRFITHFGKTHFIMVISTVTSTLKQK